MSLVCMKERNIRKPLEESRANYKWGLSLWRAPRVCLSNNTTQPQRNSTRIAISTQVHFAKKFLPKCPRWCSVGLLRNSFVNAMLINPLVGNVPYNMGEEQLIDAFKSVGQVVGFRYVP